MAEQVTGARQLALPRRHNFDALTSLRFAAATLVFLHHLEGNFGIPVGEFPLRRLAVSFFFVLSGYMLYAVYQDREIRYAGFQVNRFSRIFPIHVVVLGLTLLLYWNHYLRLLLSDPIYWLGNLTSTLLLLQCWNPTREWVFTGNGVTWSLSVLVFFYAVFPALMRVRRFLFPIWLLSILGSLWLLQLVTAWNTQLVGFYDPVDVAHFFPPMRLVEFVTGMIAARIYLAASQKKIRRTFPAWSATVLDVLVVLLLILARWQLESFVLNSGRVYPNPDELVWETPDQPRLPGAVDLLAQDPEIAKWLVDSTDTANLRQDQNGVWFYFDKDSVSFAWLRWLRFTGMAIPSAAVILWFTVSPGGVARLLKYPLLVAAGTISYAFFLIHGPVIQVVDLWFEPLATRPVLAGGICFVLAILLSIILYRYVEIPGRDAIRNWYSRFPRPKRNDESKTNA